MPTAVESRLLSGAGRVGGTKIPVGGFGLHPSLTTQDVLNLGQRIAQLKDPNTPTRRPASSSAPPPASPAIVRTDVEIGSPDVTQLAAPPAEIESVGPLLLTLYTLLGPQMPGAKSVIRALAGLAKQGAAHV